MGEIFRRERAAEELEWTGERLVTGIEGQIESEHLHRYFLARSLCSGKDVLDIASGEGYGTALLAQTAASAIGVELDTASVEYARRAYRAANLQYVLGDATQIPLADGSVDVVVSFETIEHFLEHDKFLKEIRRVLRPSGFLIISTPDSDNYSGVGTPPNSFHRRELNKRELLDELNAEFEKIAILRQRVVCGSAILAEADGANASHSWIYEQRDRNTFEIHRQLPHPPYLLAIASNSERPLVDSSFYIHIHIDPELVRLQAVEEAVREQAPRLHQTISEGEAAKIEAAVARQEAAAAKQEAAAAAEQAARLAAAITLLEGEIGRMRMEDTVFRGQAVEREALLKKEREEARELADTLGGQLRASELLARQQALVVQRLQREMELCQNDLRYAAEAANRGQEVIRLHQETVGVLQVELANLRTAYDEICKLIIPVWLRKSIPGSLRNLLRALKRAVVRPLIGNSH